MALDCYETQAWDKVKDERLLIADALSRADDGLTEGRLDVDSWDCAFMQLSRAQTYLQRLIQIVNRVRNRRLSVARPAKRDKGEDKSNCSR